MSLPPPTLTLPNVMPGSAHSDRSADIRTGGFGGPVGELKKVVTLVDRGAFEEHVYPRTETATKFQPVAAQNYHNFTQDVAVWPFAGSPAWGQRITFSVPWPWQADFLNWIALRLKPLSWMPPSAQSHIGSEVGDWVPTDTANFWAWAASLGTAAIARAEMEVDGVIIESFSGDWLNVWNKTLHSCSEATAYDDVLYTSANPRTTPQFGFQVSEDGYMYCYLPFWFSKHSNTAFPLVSCRGPDTVRFHITLRPFHEVVAKLGSPSGCRDSPLGTSFVIRDYSFPFFSTRTIPNNAGIPGFESADLMCGISNIDGSLREGYMKDPHEILMEPVVETSFGEPLKYVVSTGAADTIKIQLPLTIANGPIRQLLFFLRRKAATEAWRDWTNYSATLAAEANPTWNPVRPLLVRAQLQVGTAVWADEEERWWRAAGNLPLPGGVRGSGNYIYAYNFAEKPAEFSPSGSLNASRVDMRLNLTVAPPGGAADGEWSVHVFLVGTNWIRFQEGLANLVFMD